MNRSASMLAIAVAAFVMGCQDNSITDPIGTTASEGPQLSKTQPVNTLAFHTVLHEPGNVYNSFLEISGAVAYQAAVVPLDPIPPNPQCAVRLNLSASAEVRPYEPYVPPMLPVWHVSGASDDWVSIPESGAAFLRKRYQIEGWNNGMLFNLEFRITLTSVELNRMWLELPRVVRAEDLD